MNYYLYQNKEKTGPYSFGQLKEMESAGTLTKEDQVYSEAKARWQAAGEMHGLFGNPFPKWSTNQKVLAGFGMGCLAMIVVPLGILMMMELFVSTFISSKTEQVSNLPPRELIKRNVQSSFTLHQQEIFDSIHPVGTAKSITIHEVNITAWKNDTPSNNADDVKQFTVVGTLYWQGPITSDGFTKIACTYDTQSQRFTSKNILATNGTTNSEFTNGMAYLGGFIGGAILREALTPSQQQ